ncbi:MAG: T9SS type A sorting domain-containing protein [Candidatus Cloacimonetes bacterium]|nr:T9SS type A sorting domain-containing protein [Candidatus Cloacimonadota bacterium]
MRYYLLIVIMLSLGVLYAAAGDVCQTTASGLSARLQNLRLSPLEATDSDDPEFPETTLLSRTYALPFQSVELSVQSLEWKVFDRNGNFLYSEQNRNLDALSVGNSFSFREMRGFTVLVETQIDDGESIRTLTNAEFSLAGQQPIPLPQSVSPAFIDAYRELADNFDTSYLRDLPVARPKMLILSHDNLANYQTSFVQWKRQQGFDVYVAYPGEIGSTLTDYRNFIQNHYQQYHCDYLLLLGDVTGQGSYTIPTAFYPSPEYAENDADDHQYTLLEGDDYFPEMLVGRMSFNDISEFLTMANKSVSYESTPFMNNTAWMTRGLAVAGNYAEGGLRPVSPVHMSRWLRDKMLDHGYAAVDTVFYPPTYPGTSSITASINQGVQFVSYRGWGDANGWHYPSFHNPDLNSTVNGPRMPVVFSIVCNTGDFANSVNPSFGEKWMRMGSVAQPNGCVAFVGPSDLHTKTRLNNSISSGAFRSIFDYGVRGFGSSVLMGKIELYKNFPNEIGPNQYVAFYYHVYNLQGDPSLKMWVLVPGSIPESVIEGGLTFSPSASHIRINAPANLGAMVTGTRDGINYTHAQVKNGFAILPLDPQQSGDLTITVSQENFLPLVRTLSPSEPAGIGITANNAAQQTLNPNSVFEAEVTLKNFSAAPVTLNELDISADEYATVDYNHSPFTLAAGETQSINFTITGHADIVPRRHISFTLQSAATNLEQQFQMYGGGAEFTILNASGLISIGGTSSVEFQVMNTSASPLSDALAQCVSLTGAANFENGGSANLGNFGPGETKTFSVDITVGSEAWHGRNLPMKMVVSSNGYSNTAFYSLTAGTPATTSPTGPDEYGYFAYDSFDAGFAQTPVYNWIETDPALGGQGTVWEVMDDGSLTVDLPFSFRFYGREYNHVTMCSNGWISLLPTDMVDFYNCYIPAALGPYAMIAGYWDDLKGMKTGDNTFSNMRLIRWHDAANNRYIVQWNDAYNQYNIDLMENASLEKFQIILYPQADRDGDIVVQYHTVDNPGLTTNYCTVGIENHTQTVGLGYTHGNVYPPTATPLQAGLAIKFTTLAPDSYVAANDPVAVPFALEQNYPNPFNPSTTLSFSLAQSGQARLAVYNTKGQLIRTLVDSELSGGKHSVVWNGLDEAGKSVSSGVYLYKLETAGASQTRRMLLMK